MTFSFSRLIISESDTVTYREASGLAEKKHPQPERRGTAAYVGEIDSYKIWLGFKKGVPAWECSCVKNVTGKITKPCSHMLALSLLWDRSRNVPDPSPEDVAYLTRKH